MTRIYTGVGRHTPIKVQLAFAAIWVVILAACGAALLGAVL